MAPPRGLHALARLHGVQTAYHANDGTRIAASPEALMAALRARRVPVRDAASIRALLEHRRREIWERVVEPVVVTWREDEGDGSDSRSPALLLRLPAHLRETTLTLHVVLEQGGERMARIEAGRLEPVEETEVDGRPFVALRASLPTLPPGYHDLIVEAGKGRWEALLVCAPRRAVGWADAFEGEERLWGVFAPLYALWSRDEPEAVPGYHQLDALAERVADRGGRVVGTLPLLAAFLDRPHEPSPYSPVSRLFWNEVYVEPGRAAAADAPGAGTPAAAVGEAGSAESYLDFRAAMAAKRPLLEAGARRFFEDGEPPELEPFLARNPRARDYARFRALVERHGEWHGWQDRLRARDIRPGDYDDDVARYHLYVQWLAERQLAEVTERAWSRGVGLYLDLPLGVHPAGYDVWRDRELFALGASAGAPPDALAPHGQDWGFRPLDPEASRLDRHRYFVASIRKHLRFSRVLRIDHVMQLHRLFWVPQGGDAGQGVYMRYPAEELYAILCLESRRAGAVVVGEDLGTVPREARRGMRRHGLPGMYVVQFELEEQQQQQQQHNRQKHDSAQGGAVALVPRRVPRRVVGSVGTHDTPTFAGWWWGRDAELRQEAGQMEPDAAAREVEGRADLREKLARGLGVVTDEDGAVAARGGAEEEAADDVARSVHEELLLRLGRSRAGLVLATLEDLWLEREPQNVPGTMGERNWRRRARRPLEALDTADVAAVLQRLDESRRRNE